MSLVTMREILPYAEEKKIAIPAFNIDTMEITQAILETVEEENCPAIIAVGQAAIKDGKLESLAATVRTLAKDMKTPVVLHLDHGQSVEQVVKALCAGFTSVMIDGSKLSFEDNIAVTQEVVRIANAAGASVEAELGAILGSEDNISHDDSKPFLVRVQDVIDFTAVMIDGSKLSFEDNIAVTQEVVRIANAAGASVEAELGAILGSEDNISHDDSKPFLVRVQDVIDFTAAVKVDALAVGIGNAHGLYKGRPNLDFQRLQEVRDVTDVPLVLHGGSGIPDDMIQTAIEIGIRKINVATEIRMAYVEGLLSGSANGDYYEMVKAGKASVKARAKSKIDLFLRK